MTRPSRPFARVLAAVLLAGAGAAPAAPAQDTVRTADYDVEELDFPPLADIEPPEPERMELDNGMTVFLLEDHELPQIQASARIGVGSVYEPAEELGLASVTGTVMRTGGTASMSSDSINRVLEGLGASVETGIGETSGSASMSTLEEHVDTVLPIFAAVLRRPAFAQEKVDQAKKQQKSAISRRNDDPRQIAFREFDKVVYGEDSPYARHPEYFTIDSISRSDLVEFHEEYYHPNNVVLSVWGDFETVRMKERVREAFGDWERAEGFTPPTPPDPAADRAHSVNFIQKEDVSQSTVLMGHPGELERDDADYPAVIVMNEVLSGGFSGRLFQNVRREQGLAYSVFGNYSAGYDRPGRFFAGVFSKSGTTVEAARAVLREIERMRREPPSQHELRVARDSYLNSFVFNFDTREEVLDRLMTYEYYDYPSDFLEGIKDGVEEVSADDVLRVSRDYLYPEQSHVLVLGRRQDFSQDLSVLASEDTVRTIDISIPTGPPEAGKAAPEATDEERAAGREKLLAARDALGGEAFEEVETLRIEGVTVQQTPTGSVTLPTTTAVALPDRLRVEQTLPNGMTITIVDDGETMTLRTPRGTRQAPARLRERIAGQVWRNLVYLMANLDREGLEARDLGTEELEGTSYRAVEVTPPEGDAFTLYLDPDTMRPARLGYTATTRQGPREATSVYGDYREVSGVTVPFETVTYRDGEESGRTTLSTVEINADLEQGLFSIGGSG